MFNNLFSKIMGSYILIPILILLALLLFLPDSLEDYFFQAKRQELIRKGELIGKTLSKYSENELQNFFPVLERLIDNSFLIINKHGEIINNSQQMKRMMKDHTQRMNLSNKMHHGRMHHGKMHHNKMYMSGLKKELDEVLAGRLVSFRGELPMLNQPIIGVGIPVQSSNNSGRLALFLFSPLQGLQQTVIKVRNLTLRVTIVAVFLAVLLGYFISKGISKPVKKMKDKAQKMAAGNFKVKLDQLPNDEIGELGASFNYLATELEKNIETLDTERKKMKEMLTSMAEGVLGVSTTKRVLFANPRLKEIFDIESKIIDYNLNKTDITELVQLVDKVISEQKEIKQEFSWKERIIVAHAAPIKKGSEEIGGIIILVRDVTELRKLDEMRQLFVANVSHELKTPLTAIRGYLEAILDGVVEDVELKRKYLKRVLSETDRMTRLVKDILDLSRLQAGQFDFKLEEFDLISLIYSIINDFITKIENREITVDAPQKVILIADKDKLEQVIINLISNAIKFTGKDGVINIKVEKINSQVKVRIIDNGVGIPKSELSYIWERFYQVDRARRPDKEGTGLGLAIVKEIIEGLEGEVAVNSNKEEGSEFSFTLPNVIDFK